MLDGDVGLLLLSGLVWVVILTIQNLMTDPFLRRLEFENPKKKMEVSTGAEQFWDHTKSFRIGVAYLLRAEYETWGLSTDLQAAARRLRLVSVFAVLSTDDVEIVDYH